MGHADRPGQHHAVGLDSQPRRICLSTGGSRHANTDTDRIANSNRNRNSNTNRNSHGHGNRDTKANAHTKTSADTQTSSNTSASPVGAHSR